MKVVSTRPVSLTEVKEILVNRKVGDVELGYEQKETLEYAEKFAKRSKKECEALVEKVMKHAKKLSEEAAIKIADLKPKNLETIKAILLKDKIELTEEELNGIYKELH